MALQDLKTYYESIEKEDFNSLLKQKCLVTEKIQASSLHAVSYTHLTLPTILLV